MSLRVRRPAGRTRLQILVAYGLRADGRRQVLAFRRSQGESQSAVRADLRTLYQAASRREAPGAPRQFEPRWQGTYPQVVRSIARDLPELVAFFDCPRALWGSLRIINIIDRCFVEVRHRTRPMVCFVNVQNVDRILYSIFNRFNLEWAQHTLRAFTQAA